jgi:hypothetical protein
MASADKSCKVQLLLLTMLRHELIRKSGSELAQVARTAELAMSGKHLAGQVPV